MAAKVKFPIDMKAYRHVILNLNDEELSDAQVKQLKKNIELARDAIVFFTAYAGVKRLGGHTGGAFDITPEMIIADSIRKGRNHIHPVIFDEAGHRVAAHYLLAAINGFMPFEDLMQYRQAFCWLPGHPEKGETPGIEFSSGRLGHMWSFVNGVALANPHQKTLIMGSDGSQQEGNNAEAARFASTNNLEVKLFIDDNNMTITGHPKEYLRGYDIEKTLQGHGINTKICNNPEDIRDLYRVMRWAILEKGTAAVVIRRKMAQGIKGIEDTTKGHDVIPKEAAIEYLKVRKYDKAINLIENAIKQKAEFKYKGSTSEFRKARDKFGKVVCEILGKMSYEERIHKVKVIDNDLAGSTGLHFIKEEFPEVYINGGIMERNNFSVAAGFGNIPSRIGITATFSAFLEMLPSEITMARYNDANVLAHFSHSGVDWMADNNCHFGINHFFADNGIAEGDITRLYFPADWHQMGAIVKEVWDDPGLKFVFSTRSPTPFILDEKGNHMFDISRGYRFKPKKDEVVREGTDGYIVTYGEMLYRCLDVVETLREEGKFVGLINKPTINKTDKAMMAKIGQAPFVLLVESQNYKTGLGIRFGTWLLEAGYSPLYQHLGVTKLGITGLWEQLNHQGLNPYAITKVVRSLLAKSKKKGRDLRNWIK
ncbi:transketolase C-terminal domain-containing protein [Promethearchaeum syntrophicum]|uniref:Transketolase C-terminal domain-containing protein n=1 Tax=Promethearchaeum syntrophicum TaxID=2594042 RepID=A0A5B9DFC9_9ARCH|nr:transketolase C-terminal domain-containing protein [Candidatus Prometheoarchaeum syntrophicum]QEE17436.1 transketolase [Candidatus Prometheoarchaeum syntrophicum]